MNSIKAFTLVSFMVFFSGRAWCQDFKSIDGLGYKIYGDHKGPKPVIGDTTLCDMLFYGDDDSLVYNSIEKKQIIPIPMMKSQFKGDLMEGIQLMNVGDSAIFLVNSDSVTKLAKLAGNSSTLKPGSHLKYIIVLRGIYKQRDQSIKDEDTIVAYIKKNKIKGMKRTSDGLYYKITQEGTGDVPAKGKDITAHYTGEFLNGKVFDSDKNRPGPGLTFTLGYRQVIKGWEEAFSLMKKGSKATLIIPSALAYGPGGNGAIPANTVLLFDVELVDIK